MVSDPIVKALQVQWIIIGMAPSGYRGHLTAPTFIDATNKGCESIQLDGSILKFNREFVKSLTCDQLKAVLLAAIETRANMQTP